MDVRERLRTVADRLRDVYGEPRWHVHRPPIDELVLTILSQHTSDMNAERAFRSLRERFSTWEEVAAASPDAVADAIRSGGLANVKAPRIQAALRQLLSAGNPTALHELATLSVKEARARLVSLPGVGAKTASCVLLFSLGRPAMPVDTHVHRVCRRLRLVHARASAESTQDVLEELLGNNRDAIYALHMNVIAHGRTVCTARQPKCTACCLSDICPTWNEQQPHDD
jgi:endonuclease-3